MSTPVVLVPGDVIVSTARIERTLMTELDELAIRLVALDGHRMKLKKEERTEAIKLMAQHNVPQEQMAWRLCINVETLRRQATRDKIKLSTGHPTAHWTYEYMVKPSEERKEKIRADARRRAATARQVGKQRSDELERTTTE